MAFKRFVRLIMAPVAGLFLCPVAGDGKTKCAKKIALFYSFVILSSLFRCTFVICFLPQTTPKCVKIVLKRAFLRAITTPDLCTF